MRTKVTLALLFLNVVLFFFIFKFEVGWRTERASLEARPRVLGSEAANIQFLEITGPALPGPVALVRRGDGPDSWFVTQPFEWPANRLAVNSITSGLALLNHENSFAVADLARNGQSLADYGLETPGVTVTFSSADPAAAGGVPASQRHTIALGDKTGDGNYLYLLSPDRGTIHVVRRNLADSLAQTVDQLRSDTLFSISDFEARTLTISGRSRAAIARQPDDSWMFESPLVAPASRNETRLAINELGALRVGRFLTPPPAGLAAALPTLRIVLEGRNRTETLLLFDPAAPAAAAGTAPPAAEYQAQMSGRPTFFTVAIPAALKAKLENASIALRERRLLDFDPRAVTRIALSRGGGPEVGLQRLEAGGPAGAPAVAPWRLEAGGAGRPEEADGDTIARLLERLTRINVREFANDAPTPADLDNWGFNRPERILQLTLAPRVPGEQPRVLRLRLGLDGARRRAFAQIGESGPVYEVDPELPAEIPAEPLAYRNRLLRALPEGTRISELRLIDLSTGSVVFQKSNPPPQGQPADPAINALVAHLRNLRAREFLPGGFSETGPAAGVAWRHRLDLTLALAGGATEMQTEILPVFLSERTLGASAGTQYAGSPAFGAAWTLEQPLIDALWTATYGGRDPGPPAER